MKNLWRLFLLLVVLALGVWLWTVFFPNDETRIRKLLAETARAASFSNQESPLSRMAGIAKFSSCFTPDVQVSFEIPRQGRFALEGQDQIMALAARARDAVGSAKVTFLDVTVSRAGDTQSATAVLTARADIPGDPDFNVQEMKFFLKKINGRWLISRVETVKTLSTLQVQPFNYSL